MADNETDVIPRTLDKFYLFTSGDGPTEIIVQTANFVHYKGGEPPVFYIGNQENILHKQRADDLFQFAIVGFLLAMSFYHLLLFVVNSKRKTELVFALCCFLSFSLTGKSFQILRPGYRWWLIYRGIAVAHFMTSPVFGYLFQRMFPGILPKKVFYSYYLFCGVFITFPLFLPTKVFTAYSGYFDLVSIIFLISIFISMAWSLRKGKVKDVLAFSGLLILVLFAISDFMGVIGLPKPINLPGIQFMFPFGMMFFIFCYAIMLEIDNTDWERAAMEATLNEERLAMQNNSLETLNRMKNDLMATVSHETRTPLAVLSGYAELISRSLRKKGVDLQTAKDLDGMADEIQRIATIIEEMQRFSSEREQTKDKALIDIAPIVHQCANLYRPILLRKNSTLTVAVEEELPYLYANSLELTQVLFNLLQNAKEHCENGTVSLSAQTKDDTVTIMVADTGTGIAPNILSRVFERGVSGKENGSGLGLAISKEIIIRHGGDITAKNTENGATITVTFPVELKAGSTIHESNLTC